MAFTMEPRPVVEFKVRHLEGPVTAGGCQSPSLRRERERRVAWKFRIAYQMMSYAAPFAWEFGSGALMFQIRTHMIAIDEILP